MRARSMGLEHDAGVLRRVPDAVPQVLQRVPREPPVDHVGGELRVVDPVGDVAGAVGQVAPADLHAGLERRDVEQAVDLLRVERVGRVHGLVHDRVVRGVRLRDLVVVVLGERAASLPPA